MEIKFKNLEAIKKENLKLRNKFIAANGKIIAQKLERETEIENSTKNKTNFNWYISIFDNVICKVNDYAVKKVLDDNNKLFVIDGEDIYFFLNTEEYRTLFKIAQDRAKRGGQ